MNKKRYQTISQAAQKWGVSTARVYAWIDSGRLDTWEPAPGVRLIRVDAERPEARRPWHTARRERISRED